MRNAQNMIEVVFIMVACATQTLGVKRNPFRNDKIRQRRRDPARKLIKDEFLVIFDEDCLSQQNTTQTDVINEFLNLYPCYTFNRDDQTTKKYRNIGDYWIVVNKKKNCNNHEEPEIEFDDYCITEVEQDEETKGIDDLERFEVDSNDYKWTNDFGDYVNISNVAWIILLSILLLIICINCYIMMIRRKPNVKVDNIIIMSICFVFVILHCIFLLKTMIFAYASFLNFSI